jgi:hypothetical protein
MRKPLRLGIVASALALSALILMPSAASASVSPGTYPGTLNSANAPSGTHLQTGAISCTVAADLSITCSSYELAGVGHTNAVDLLTARYTAIVDCFNPGVNPNNPIESHTTDFTASDSDTLTSAKNGRLRVFSLSVNPASVGQVCPNPNWTPVIRGGTLTLVSFSYTLTFEGFSAPAVEISQTDP